MPSLWMLFASFAFAVMGATVKLASEQYSIVSSAFGLLIRPAAATRPAA